MKTTSCTWQSIDKDCGRTRVTWSSEGTLKCGRTGRFAPPRLQKEVEPPTENDKQHICLALSEIFAHTTGKSTPSCDVWQCCRSYCCFCVWVDLHDGGRLLRRSAAGSDLTSWAGIPHIMKGCWIHLCKPIQYCHPLLCLITQCRYAAMSVPI